MSPLVSVIIPVRNEELDLPKAIQSIAEQSYPLDQIEVIVVDGDSTDQTELVAKDALAALPLQRYEVMSNPGGNTPSNLNRGLAWSRGQFIVRVDARSHIPSDYILRTTRILDRESGVVVVGGSQVAVSRSPATRDRAIEFALNNPLAMGGSKYRRGAASGPADTVYLGVFRRTQLVGAGGWDEHFSTNQDFDLNRRMAKIGDIWFESALPVAYVPRRTVSELFWQYHRFGRWKAHYWSRVGERPQPRQLLLLAVPPLALMGAGAIVPQVLRRFLPQAVLGLAGLGGVALRRVGPVAAWGWTINLLIGTGWWSGVLRGFLKDDVT